MIKMLIADDEKMIREGILHIVDWEHYGIEVIGAAADGLQAKAMFESARPDIVITDIRMPKLNGLELTQEIRSIDDNVKVIILSGYDEFSYAQQALRLGASDYLLKPLMPDKLVEKVLEMKELCLIERSRGEEEHRLRIQLEESMPILRERFLQELSIGQVTDEEIITEKLRYLRLELSLHQQCCVVIVQLEQMDVETEPSEEGNQLLLCQAGNLLQSKIKGFGEAFLIQSGCYGLIFQFADFHEHEEIQETLKRICRNIQVELEMECGVGSTIGIGTTSDSILTVRASYQTSVEALKYKTILGSGNIIVFGEMEPGQLAVADYSGEAERNLIFSVKHADISQIEIGLDEYLRSSARIRELDYAIMMSMKLIYSLSIQLTDMSFKLTEIIGTDYEIWERLKRCLTIPDIINEMKAILIQLAQHMLNKRDGRQHRWIEQTVAYLQEHYNETLSLKKLSEEIYLSPNYICSLFKEETGQNISDYLTQLRIEKAKELLGENGIKIYEVANHVGYADSRYFNKMFKKHTGMNMSEFRDRH
jgi:two-component system response regulator YesN